MSWWGADWLGPAVALWLGQFWSSDSCTCNFTGEVCHVSEQIIELLRGQLDRCGPAQLSCPPCPGCPVPVCPSGSAGGGLLVFVVGALCGAILVSAGPHLALRWRREAVEHTPATPWVTTPTTRRALR